MVEAKKSALINLKQGQTLFHEGDPAASLFIIQKGQLRLFRPKGKGYVELTVLRAGEVLGEMAYFAQEESEKRRSCSAQAIVETDIIEISFVAFGKTMENLNPWFKTIINTLVDRLRKGNARIKELETNSVTLSYGGGGSGQQYEFFKSADIIKLLSSFYLVIKATGKQEEKGSLKISMNMLRFFCIEIFTIAEIKVEEFILLLKTLGILKGVGTENKEFLCPKVEKLKNLLDFFNKQRTMTNEKQLKISPRCEMFLDYIIMQIEEGDIPESGKVEVNISSILNEFKAKNIHVDLEDLQQAKDANLVSEIIVGSSNKLTCTVHFDELKSYFLPIQMKNAILKLNQKKQQSSK